MPTVIAQNYLVVSPQNCASEGVDGVLANISFHRTSISPLFSLTATTDAPPAPAPAPVRPSPVPDTPTEPPEPFPDPGPRPARPCVPEPNPDGPIRTCGYDYTSQAA